MLHLKYTFGMTDHFSEEGQRRESRPTIDQLRERVSKGEGIHTVIGSVLSTDAHYLFSYHERSRLAQHGTNTLPLDTEIIDLYGLEFPEGLDDKPLPTSLDFVGGFSAIANHYYQELAVASQGELRSSENPLGDKILSNLKPADAARIREQLGVDAVFEDIGEGVVREALAEDPSGITWLKGRVKEELANKGGLELVGANRAIAGAEKLYKALTEHSS